MKKILNKLKDFYATYKVVIWLSTLFGSSWGLDRVVNLWNVPQKLETYRAEFIEKRKGDSIMFIEAVNELNQKVDSILTIKTKIK